MDKNTIRIDLRNCALNANAAKLFRLESSFPPSEACKRCGKPATGYARMDGERYCHSDDPYPTCYMLTLWESKP